MTTFFSNKEAEALFDQLFQFPNTSFVLFGDKRLFIQQRILKETKDANGQVGYELIYLCSETQEDNFDFKKPIEVKEYQESQLKQLG